MPPVNPEGRQTWYLSMASVLIALEDTEGAGWYAACSAWLEACGSTAGVTGNQALAWCLGHQVVLLQPMPRGDARAAHAAATKPGPQPMPPMLETAQPSRARAAL